MMSTHDRPDVQTTNSSSGDDGGGEKVRRSYMGRNSLRNGFGSSRSNVVRPSFCSCYCFRCWSHRVGRSLSSLVTELLALLERLPAVFSRQRKGPSEG